MIPELDGNHDTALNTPNFKVHKKERDRMRGELLNKIVASYNTEDEHIVLFEQMVDLEESFVQEI